MACPCAPQYPFATVRSSTLGALGQSVPADVAPPAWDIKRDVLAGGVGLALPIAYGYLAPKTWPKLNIFAQVAVVVVGYFGTVWTYQKLTQS